MCLLCGTSSDECEGVELCVMPVCEGMEVVNVWVGTCNSYYPHFQCRQCQS